MRTISHSLMTEMERALPAEAAELAIPSYNHPNPLMRWMAWRRVEIVIELLDGWAASCSLPKAQRQIMDYGCGTGVLFPRLREIGGRVHGVDVVTTAASIHVERQGWTEISLSTPEKAKRLPNHSLDVIVAAEVLEHLIDLEDTLALFRAKLKDEGVFIVSVPTENACYRLGRRLAGFSGVYHHHDAQWIHESILRARFAPRRVVKTPFRGPLAIYWIVQYHLG